MAAQAQPTSACRQQLWQDSRAVAADLTVIRNEIVGGDSDAYRQAVEQVADSLTANVPAMARNGIQQIPGRLARRCGR
jgi:hypothetical protein